jgi:hypothetical protein
MLAEGEKESFHSPLPSRPPARVAISPPPPRAAKPLVFLRRRHRAPIRSPRPLRELPGLRAVADPALPIARRAASYSFDRRPSVAGSVMGRWG